MANLHGSRLLTWAVVLAKLVEWSFPTPEACSSNPDIATHYIERLLSIVLKRRK